MWYLTKRKNGTLVTNLAFDSMGIEAVLKFFKDAGYEEDPLFTMPEWNRYCLIKHDGQDYREVYLEED